MAVEPAVEGTVSQVKILIVDDEDEFREATGRVLRRRGFEVSAASSGERALALLDTAAPDVVLLDLKMEGIDGITTLRRIRERHADLPVIILTGHGNYGDAVAGIRLKIVDFLQKPVDVEKLAQRIRSLLGERRPTPLREPTVAELMVPVSSYARVYGDQAIGSALRALQESFFHRVTGKLAEQGHRSVLVFDREDAFLGVIRIADVVRAAIPEFLRDSPYSSFFTGMFLAQCKTLGGLRVADLLRSQPSQPHVRADTPLMEAAHLMVSHQAINLPVLQDGELVGMLRDKDLLLEIARQSNDE